MIKKESEQSALCALNRVLVILRFEAQQREETRDLADVLDRAEYLVRLLASDDDRTDDFRKQVEGLADAHAAFGPVVGLLNEPPESLDW